MCEATLSANIVVYISCIAKTIEQFPLHRFSIDSKVLKELLFLRKMPFENGNPLFTAVEGRVTSRGDSIMNSIAICLAKSGTS